MTNNNDVGPFIVMDTNIEEILDLNESLNRLLNNPDFKKVFLDHYLNKFILEKTSLLTRSNIRGGVIEVLAATSYLKAYLTDIHTRAMEYEASKKETKAEIEVDTNKPFGDTNE